MKRREFLHRTAGGLLAGIAAPGLFASTRQSAPHAEIIDTRVVSRQPDLYHGWPTLARTRSGRLWLVCSGGREEHVCPFGRVEIQRSDDGGSTWSWPRVLLDGPIDDRDAGVVETRTGALLVTTFTSLAYQPGLERAIAGGNWPKDRLERWQSAHARATAEERKKALGVWVARSDDAGVSWSGRSDSLVNSPHGPIQLSDGRLLYAGKDLWREGSRVGFCESKDDGRTWSWLAELPTRDGDRHEDYHELHAVESDDGKLVAHIRNHNRNHSGETLQSESSDGGKTWTSPHSIGVWGLPSHLLRLGDGRLLMSYGHRRPPFGNQVRVSSDGGKTWSDALVISGDGAGGDLGYPSTVELDDGVLVSAWYERLASSPRAVLRQARWRWRE